MARFGNSFARRAISFRSRQFWRGAFKPECDEMTRLNLTLGKLNLALGTAIGGLFAVNSVTGVWNLVEARKDPNRGHLPLIHSLLALGADAGFLATAAITPGDHDDGPVSLSSNRGTHRAMAFTSMGLATASYLVMLIGNR